MSRPAATTSSRHATPDTLLWKVLILVVLLSAIAAGLWFAVNRMPAEFRGTYWILGEHGNQIFRADQLAGGKILYRDLDCQYGPLPVALWYGFASLAGNTISANIHFQSGLTLVFIAALAWWAVSTSKDKRAIIAVAIALVVLTFARTPYLYLLTSLNSNIEYVTIERLCLLGLMILWRPPGQRSIRHMLALVLIFSCWQAAKVGGAFFGLAAYGLVDLLWRQGHDQQTSFRDWIKWWCKVAMGILVAEAARCGFFLLMCGYEQGWRSAWPFYVASDYQRTWLNIWVSAPRFIAAVIPIFGLVLLLGGFLWKALKGCWAWPLEDVERIVLFQGSVAGIFYILGAVPQIGYFGHQGHFFQYQWCLLPFGLACLRLFPWPVLCFLLAIHVGPLNRTVKEIVRAMPPHQLEQLQTPIGSIISYPGDAKAAFLKTALEYQSQESHKRSLIMGNWGGGGWYAATRQREVPHNIFFNSGMIRRQRDGVELEELLGSVEMVLMRPPPSAIVDETELSWVKEIAGSAVWQILRRDFHRVDLPDPASDSGWMLLLRKTVIPLGSE